MTVAPGAPPPWASSGPLARGIARLIPRNDFVPLYAGDSDAGPAGAIDERRPKVLKPPAAAAAS